MIPDILMTALWLLFVLGAGWSVSSLIAGREAFTAPGKTALSYGLGLGLLTFIMTALSLLDIRFNIFSVTLWAMPLVIAAIVKARADFLPRPARDSAPFSGLEIFFISAISLEIAYVLFRAFIRPLEGYDAIAMYALKAKIFYLQGIIPHGFAAIFKDWMPHIEYPLLISLAETSIYVFCGSLNDLLAKSIFPLYYLSILAFFYFMVRRFLDRRGSLLFLFLLASVPQFTDFATNGYADLPFSFYSSASFFCMYLWLRERKNPYIILSFVLLIFAVWTKPEGLMFVCVNAAVLLFCTAREKDLLARAAVYAIFSLLLLALYVFISRFMGMPVNSDFNASGIPLNEKFRIAVERIPLILYEYQIQFFGPKKWNIVWMLFIAGFLLNFKKAFSKALIPVTLVILFMLSGYSVVYMLSTSPRGIEWHLSTSGSRLFLHFLPMTVFWLALLYKELKLEI